MKRRIYRRGFRISREEMNRLPVGTRLYPAVLALEDGYFELTPLGSRRVTPRGEHLMHEPNGSREGIRANRFQLILEPITPKQLDELIEFMERIDE